ncbi:MAG: hypothetical protein GAK40_00700 [Burkholderia plantarii]|nr:MAG: hypothetical protein GAK40_00700 [Burkholderia plantarii]
MRASRPGTLIVYRAPLAPGTPLNDTAEAQATAVDGAGTGSCTGSCTGTGAGVGPFAAAGGPDEDDGFRHFCLVEVCVSHIDYLELAGPAHVRAAFTFGPAGWSGQWLAP